jgi:Fur family peroxide stress response transcriptional regulator
MEAKTKQFRKRQAILACLRGTDSHPSAEMLHGMLQAEHPDISLATVYRNLALFKQQGIIQSIGTVGGIERFDANTMPHVHFMCTSCYAVMDLPQLAVPKQLCSTVESATGGKVGECQLSFTGKCQSCCQNEKTA